MRPGSAPILDESSPRGAFKSDYYTAYNGMEDYLHRMGTVHNRIADEAAVQTSLKVQSPLCNWYTSQLGTKNRPNFVYNQSELVI